MRLTGVTITGAERNVGLISRLQAASYRKGETCRSEPGREGMAAIAAGLSPAGSLLRARANSKSGFFPTGSIARILQHDTFILQLITDAIGAGKVAVGLGGDALGNQRFNLFGADALPCS